MGAASIRESSFGADEAVFEALEDDFALGVEVDAEGSVGVERSDGCWKILETNGSRKITRNSVEASVRIHTV